MIQDKIENRKSVLEITPELKEALNETRSALKVSERRKFMARIVKLLGPGGQRQAERELGWDRKTIIKGNHELTSGFDCKDDFSGRGRKPTEAHLPDLSDDIRAIVEPKSQTDPTFRTTQLYSPITAEEVRRRLIESGKYSDEELPKVRTIRKKLNQLNYSLRKVAKTKPKKKIAETDLIFENVHRANKLADETEGVIRISIDAKATINIGPFSRGGYNRTGIEACDHDFGPESVLKLFGIYLPASDENYFYFSESCITADFMIDALENLWPMIKTRFDPHTIAINLDNGPENSSRRTQFINRLVQFAKGENVDINLTYYPPYHSKYNPIERVWGVLEKHWKGELLTSVEKVLGLARTMKWNGKNPIVTMIQGIYKKGISLSQKVMQDLEKMIIRVPGIEKWAVDIWGYEG